jgi:uncharacterized surface protein with fasciclin (FAS1) repeats
MKRTTSILMTLSLMVLGLAATGCSDSDDPIPTPLNDGPAALNIVETAASVDIFSTLVAAVEAAELVDTLANGGPFTVFAPTNEAFGALPPGTVDDLLLPENQGRLIEILTYHVVPEALDADQVLARDTLNTVQGGLLDVSTRGSDAFVNESQIIEVNIEASNGIIHVIDQVLIP